MDDWKLQPASDIGLPAGQRPACLRREPGLLETAGHLFWRSIVRGYLAGVHRLRVEHAQYLPTRPPFVMISNHCSHMDALVLASPLPLRICDSIFPIAAGDVFFRTPMMAWFAAGFINALPMWRRNCGGHAMQTLRARLVEEPCAYILFPEGTRARDGVMKPFRSGLGMIVAGTEVPVIPCHVSGTFAALPADRHVPRPARITLNIGEPLRFNGVANDRDGWNEIARASESAVAQLA